jgi:Tfp pilus assembly protein PilF
VLARRAEALTADGDVRLACHLVEMAYLADPDDLSIHAIRATVYDARRRAETSFMATGIYRAASLDSRDRLTS